MSDSPSFPDPSFPNPSFPSPSFPSPPAPQQPTVVPPPLGTFGTPPAPQGSGPTPPPGWTPQPEPQPEQGGSKTAYILLAAAVVIALGVVGFLLTREDDKSVQSAQTTITIPAVTIPEITIPEITIPAVTIPEITIPEITVPAVTVPAATAPPATVPVVPTNLFTGTQAADVIAQIATARGAAPLRILQALFYPEYAFAQVQDPTIPANVDEYQWRGTLGSPAPVTLMGDGDLEANLFSDTEVNWAVIPALVTTALAQIPIEGAEVTHISIQRNLPFSDAVQMRVFVNGTRGSGYLDADAQGNVIAVNTG